MGLFKNRKKSRDAPKVKDRTAGSSFAFFMGSSSSGKSVTERSAMQMTGIIEFSALIPIHLHLVWHQRIQGNNLTLAVSDYLCIRIAPKQQVCHQRFAEHKRTHLGVRLIVQ